MILLRNYIIQTISIENAGYWQGITRISDLYLSFITMTLKTGSTIGSNKSSAIGFTLTLNSAVPTQTTQPITATILNGSGSDSVDNNNTYSTIVIAQ